MLYDIIVFALEPMDDMKSIPRAQHVVAGIVDASHEELACSAIHGPTSHKATSEQSSPGE